MNGDTERETRVTITGQPSFLSAKSWHAWGDGYLLPDHFSARVDGDWLPGYVHLEIAVDGRGVRCASVRLEARQGEAITARALRDVPLKECVRLATATIARRGHTHAEGGTFRIELASPDDPAEPLTLASKRPHRRVKDEWLREAARIYLAAKAVEEPPTRAVEQQHSQCPITYKTAARWVELARRRIDPNTGKQFLTPASITPSKED